MKNKAIRKKKMFQKIKSFLAIEYIFKNVCKLTLPKYC